MSDKECSKCGRLYGPNAWAILDVDGFQEVPPEGDEPGYWIELRTCACNGTMAVEHPPGVDPRKPIDLLAEQVRARIQKWGIARKVSVSHRLLVLRVQVIGTVVTDYRESWGLSLAPLDPLVWVDPIVQQIIASLIAGGETERQ